MIHPQVTSSGPASSQPPVTGSRMAASALGSSPPPPPAPAASPTLVGGRYELVERLGDAETSAVYRALQRPLRREVVVKLLPGAAVTGLAMLERFTREAALVQRLEHPNTIRLFDFGTDEGRPYIVFEFLRGRTLEQEIANHGPLALPRVGRIAQQTLKSLMEAHGLGIVHRDVKPANLLIVDYPGERDFVKVLDFGIATPATTNATAPALANAASAFPRNAGRAERAERLTRPEQALGTPRYMAPEQVEGTPVGPATDLYALGLVLAEAITGAPVFGDGTAMQVWLRQASTAPAPLPKEVLATGFGPILLRATKKKQSERYASAAEMLAHVEKVLAAGLAPTDPLAAPLLAQGLDSTAEVSWRKPPEAMGTTSPMAASPVTTGPMTQRLGAPGAASPTPTSASMQTSPAIQAPSPGRSSSGGHAAAPAHPSQSDFTARTPPQPTSLPFPAASSGRMPAAPSSSGQMPTPSPLPAPQVRVTTSYTPNARVVIVALALVAALFIGITFGLVIPWQNSQLPSPSPNSRPKGAEPAGPLREITPEVIMTTMQGRGWTCAQIKGDGRTHRQTSFDCQKANAVAVLYFFDFDEPSIARATAENGRRGGAISEQDNGRVVLVYESSDPPRSSRAVLDAILHASH